MIEIVSDKVKYFCNGPFHNYEEKNITDFLNWVDETDIRILPCGRFYALKEFIHYWQGGQKFLFGFEDEKNAKIFSEKWNSPIMNGKAENNKFVLETI